MPEISPLWIVALLGAVAIAVGVAWSPKGSNLANAWRPSPAMPSQVSTNVKPTDSRPKNREEFLVDDPADLILQASTQLSRAGRAELAAKALDLSREAREPRSVDVVSTVIGPLKPKEPTA